MFKEKPVISNQYGALAMALLPFLYAFIDELAVDEVVLIAFDILEKSTPFNVGANPTVTKHKLNKPNNIIFLIPFIITTYFF